MDTTGEFARLQKLVSGLKTANAFELCAFFAYDRHRELGDWLGRALADSSVKARMDENQWRFAAEVLCMNERYDEAEALYREKLRKPSHDELFPDDQPPVINDLLIQLSSDCNLSCIYCPRTTRSGIYTHLSSENVATIVDDVVAHGIAVNKITLNQSGESILNPEFFPILKQLAVSVGRFKKRPEVLLFTGGMEMTDANLRLIFEVGVVNHFIWSVDGVDRCSYERIRKGASYERLLRHFNTFLDAKPARMRTGIYNMVDRLCHLSDADPCLGPLFARADYRAVRFPSPRSGFDYDYYRYSPYRNKGICEWSRTQAVINSDNQMVLCSVDLRSQTAFADLSQMSFYDAWHGGRSEVLGRMHSGRAQADSHQCRTCPMGDGRYEPTVGWPIGKRARQFYESNHETLAAANQQIVLFPSQAEASAPPLPLS